MKRVEFEYLYDEFYLAAVKRILIDIGFFRCQGRKPLVLGGLGGVVLGAIPCFMLNFAISSNVSA